MSNHVTVGHFRCFNEGPVLNFSGDNGLAVVGPSPILNASKPTTSQLQFLYMLNKQYTTCK